MRGGCGRPVLLPILPARGLRALLGLGGGFFALVLAARWGPALPCSWVPPHSPDACRGRALPGDGSPPFSPPWRTHALSAHVHLGVPLASSQTLLLPRAGSACCRVFPPPPPDASHPGPPWPHGRPCYRCPPHLLDPPPAPPTPLSRTRGAGACRFWTWRRWRRWHRWRLGIVMAGVIRRRAPLWARRLHRPWPAHWPVFAANGSPRPGCTGSGGGGFILSPPPTVLHRYALSRFGPSVGFIPLGQLCHSGGVGALWRLDSPAYSVTGPPWVFRYSGGLAALLLVPHSRGLVGRSGGLAATIVACTPEVLPPLFSRRPPFFHLCAGLAPWRLCAPTSLAAAEGGFPVSPPPALASPCITPAPISCVPHGVAVRVSLPLSAPPCGHRFLVRLQSRQIRRALAAPPLARAVALLLAVPSLAALSPIAVAAHLFVAPSSALLLRLRPPPRGRRPNPRPRLSTWPPCFVPVLPSFSGASPPFLHQALAAARPAPCAPSPGPAANIALRDEDVGNRMGGVVSHWLMAGGSAPRRKCPISPLTIVGGGISRPWFLHRPQQYHPVHYRPAVRHSHARADGPTVKQVECQVQLQHRLTSYCTHLLVGKLNVEPVPNSPVGVSPFLFRSPNGPAAVEYLDTPPAISWPSLIQLEITAGLLHRELTLLAHSRRPLARQRPHLHRGLCVCVCMCV